MTSKINELARCLLEARFHSTTEAGREDGQEEKYIQLAKDLTDPLFCPEFVTGIMEVVRFGASKYEANGWQQPNGVGTSKREQHASLSRHSASAYAGNPVDEDSGLLHSQLIATRGVMMYTRNVNGVTNPND